MPTPESMRHPHESIDLSGDLPVIDGGDVAVETINPWHIFVGDTRYRYNPPDRVVVTESMAEGLESHNAAVILGKGKKAMKKQPAPQNKAAKPSEDKAGDGEELFEGE